MKKRLLIFLMCVVLAAICGDEAFAQTQKEMAFSGTNYWGATPKVFQLDPERVISQTELLGVRVNESGDGPFHGAATHIVGIGYVSKGEFKYKGLETWTDKDGDKLIWSLSDLGTGLAASSKGTANVIEGTGKYSGWQGTMEYNLQFPKGFPEGTRRGVCREAIKITTK